MTVLAALQDMFTVAELTVPVQLGAVTVRGIYDETGEVASLAGLGVQRVEPLLFLVKGALAGLKEQDTLTLGALGAVTAAGGRVLRVGKIDPIQDGLLLACQLGGGR